MLQYIKYFLIALLLISNACSSFAQNNNSSLPFILQDGRKLEACKQQYQSGGKAFKSEADSLIMQADELLQIKPYSVTFLKRKLPPSGDMLDYMSQAPYWWPDTTKPDGKPYIRKDGRHCRSNQYSRCTPDFNRDEVW